MQDSQYQTRTVEYDIRLLDDSWTSHRDRTQSTPEESTGVSLCSEKKEKRNSLPVSSLTSCSHMPTMGSYPRAAWVNGVSWTHAEPVDYSTHPQNCVYTLKKKREVLLNSITEGQLNQLIDTMRSNFLLSRDDAENINAEKTLKPRIRKCFEICCEKGEEASQKALDILHSRKII